MNYIYIKKIVNHYDIYQLLQYGNDNEYNYEINQLLILFTLQYNSIDLNYKIGKIFFIHNDHMIHDLLKLYYNS